MGGGTRLVTCTSLFFIAYDRVCLSDVLSKWKQGIADGDVVISHKPLEKSETPYLPFVGK